MTIDYIYIIFLLNALNLLKRNMLKFIHLIYIGKVIEFDTTFF